MTIRIDKTGLRVSDNPAIEFCDAVLRGIGFVNFGIVHELNISAPIEIFGQGARGFDKI